MAPDIYSHVCVRIYQLAVKTGEYTVESDLVWRAWNAGNVAFSPSAYGEEPGTFNPPTTLRLAEFSDLADMLLVVDP